MGISALCADCFDLTSQDSKSFTRSLLANLLRASLVFVGGVIGLHFLANMEFSKAIAVGVTPFILPDLLKLVAITLISIPIFRNWLIPIFK